MKRLNLDEFKLKKSETGNSTDVSKLLGQVLGSCHDVATMGKDTITSEPTGSDRPGTHDPGLPDTRTVGFTEA